MNDLLYKITRLFLVAGVKFLLWSELDEGFSALPIRRVNHLGCATAANIGTPRYRRIVHMCGNDPSDPRECLEMKGPSVDVRE